MPLRSRFVAPLCVVLIVACKGPEGESEATSSTTGGSTKGGTITGSTAAETETETSGTTVGDDAGVTYFRDVKPILDRRCANCHRDGDIAPFALENHQQASMWGPILLPVIADKTMPPWGPDSACNTYLHDPSLSDDEIATVTSWVENGMPKGDPEDEPPAVDPPPPIDYDVELSGVSFSPTVYPDEYRCFLLDWPALSDRYVTAMNIVPGERSIVHHVIAYVIPAAEVDTYTALDDADPLPGYECFGGPGGEAVPRAQWLGAWAPGAAGGALPEGTGIRVEPGSKVAVQIHYHPVAGAEPDLSVVQLRTAAMVEHPAYLLPLANPLWMLGLLEMTIPAGDDDVRHTFEVDLPSAIDYLYENADFGLDEPVLLSMAGLHMHQLGTWASLSVKRGGGGEQCLVNVPRWDFNWQGVFELQTPLIVEPSDSIFLECHFNNQAGENSVAWGDGTEDEMCLGIVYVSAL